MINQIMLIKNNFQNADLHHRVPDWTSAELEEWDEGKEGRGGSPTQGRASPIQASFRGHPSPTRPPRDLAGCQGSPPLPSGAPGERTAEEQS